MDDEGDIYSNPVEQMLGKKATLERKKKTSMGPLSPPFMPPQNIVGGSIDLDQAHGLSDYASVEDAIKHTEMSAGMVHSLRRQPRRSPSMSPPPPPPMSPPDHAPILEEGAGPGVDMYAVVDTAHKQPLSPKEKGYDHLQPDDSPPMKGYDHLNPSPGQTQTPPTRPPRTDLVPKSQGTPSGKYAPLVGVAGGAGTSGVQSGGRTPSLSDVYDTLDDEGPMYATIDVCKGKKKKQPPPPPQQPPPGAADRTPSPIPPPPSRPSPLTSRRLDAGTRNANHIRMKSADLTLVKGQSSGSSPPQDVEQMYSVVQKKPRPQEKPRRAITPEEPMYSIPDKKQKRKPPPLAPKPPSRSPTPGGSMEGGPKGEQQPLQLLKVKQDRFGHVRSESLDASILSASSSAPTLPQDARGSGVDLRSYRSNSLHQQVQRSPLNDQRSPSPEVCAISVLGTVFFTNVSPVTISKLHC